MQAKTTVNILRGLTAIVGLELVLFNPDILMIRGASTAEVVSIKVVGGVLLLVGVFLPVVQNIITVIGRGR